MNIEKMLRKDKIIYYKIVESWSIGRIRFITLILLITHYIGLLYSKIKVPIEEDKKTYHTKSLKKDKPFQLHILTLNYLFNTFP